MTTKATLLKMIRLNCNECLGGIRASENDGTHIQSEMVDGCTAPECIFFDFRFGKDPRPNKNRVQIAYDRDFKRPYRGHFK